VAGVVETKTGGFKFPDGTTQTTAALGTISGLTSGTGLTGGGNNGNVTLNVDQGVVAFQSDLANEVSNRQTAETALQSGLNAKIARTGDTMTGALNLPKDGLVVGSDELALKDNNVGIGTATPAGLLQVTQTTAGPGTVSNTANGLSITGVGTQFTNTFKVGDSITIGSETVVISAITSDSSMTTSAIANANSGASYSLAGGSRLTVLGNGNVGVGTSTPDSKLTVAGVVETKTGGFKFPDGTTQTTAALGTISGLTSGTGLTGGGNNGNVTLNVDQGVVAFQSDLANEVSNRQTADTVLQSGLNAKIARTGDTMTGALNLPKDGLVVGNDQLVLAGGNMGLGTTSPSARLTISGPKVDDGSTGIEFRNTSGNDSFLLAAGIPGVTNSHLSISQGNSPELVIANGSGNVGIGTSAPHSKLQVDGGNLYVGSPGQGIVLKSPNGAVCRRLTIDNTGAMVLLPITCP
jgi:hypothetical protein